MLLRESRHGTHEVTNQVPPLCGYNAAAKDRALMEAVEREGGAYDADALDALGALAGSEEAIAWGFEANRHPPELRTHDRYGRRIDEVVFHPAWHRLMETAVAHGLHAAAWNDSHPGAHVARAAKFYVWSQVESGHACPISMTYAAVPALRANSSLAAFVEPKLAARRYDPRLEPLAVKASALAGMAMTEKQGGSDVRANTTRAERDGDAYALVGHKWFCSAPMSDAFLVLAQAPGGLTCFFLPRVLPDGSRNAFAIQRLKDKLGNRSNASSEIELDGAYAERVGDEGRGVATIIAMVAHTRLDCVLGSAALMRQGTVQAIHHARHRRAFGALLVDQPLMQNVLADLALESEAATTLALRLAGAIGAAAAGDQREAAFARIGVAIGKHWVCKRAIAHTAEAMEVFGGNGYVEENIMPRLYREAPVNSIWEGSGNVNALDVLRALRRTPEVRDALLDEVAPARGNDARLDRAIAAVHDAFAGTALADEFEARSLVETMATCLQAALLVRYAPPAVTDAFCASRLGRAAAAFGRLPAGVDASSVIERAWPNAQTNSRS